MLKMEEKLNNKTCGECRYFEPDDISACCEAVKIICNDNAPACKDFEPKPKPTNGDVIRQGGDYALAHFKSEHRCDVCAYAAPIDTAPACCRPEGKICFDGILAWLNAPAESEGEG